MAEPIAKLYTPVFKSAFNKEIDLDSDDIMVMLCGTGYTPSQSAHQYKSSVTGEISGTGYTAGGLKLLTVTVNVAGLTFTFDAGDAQWPSSTLAARYAVLYDGTPASDATRPLIGYIDFGEVVSTTSGTFQSIWNSGGIFAVTVG